MSYNNDSRYKYNKDGYRKVTSASGGSGYKTQNKRQSSPSKKRDSPPSKKRNSPPSKKRNSPPRKRKSTPPKKQPPKDESNDVDAYRIANFKPTDNFTKSVSSRQDKISEDREQMQEKFEGYILIPEEDYRCMQPGAYIRYLKDGNLYRSGGLLKLNRWPQYWVLESTDGKKIRWSLPLKNTKNIYYQKDIEAVKKKEKNKTKLYNAVMSHEYVVISKGEFEEMRAKLGKKEGEEIIENGGGTESSFTDYDSEESSAAIDITFKRKSK